MRWVGELARRKVLKVGVACLVPASVLLQRERNARVSAALQASGRPLIPAAAAATAAER